MRRTTRSTPEVNVNGEVDTVLQAVQIDLSSHVCSSLFLTAACPRSTTGSPEIFRLWPTQKSPGLHPSVADRGNRLTP